MVYTRECILGKYTESRHESHTHSHVPMHMCMLLQRVNGKALRKQLLLLLALVRDASCCGVQRCRLRLITDLSTENEQLLSARHEQDGTRLSCPGKHTEGKSSGNSGIQAGYVYLWQLAQLAICTRWGLSTPWDSWGPTAP